MKLHLPKRLLTALLAAFTAISLSTGSAAWGEESSEVTEITSSINYAVYEDTAYAYDVVQWTGGAGVCFGKWYVASYDANGNCVSLTESTSRDTWGEVITSTDRVTLLLDGTSGANTSGEDAYYDINGALLSGIIVTADSKITKLRSNAGKRRITLGTASDSTSKGYTSIEHDFTLTNEEASDTGDNGVAFYLTGLQEWRIAKDATFTLKTNKYTEKITHNGNLTISGSGATKFESLLHHQSGSITVDKQASLHLSSGYIQDAGASLILNGSLTASKLFSSNGGTNNITGTGTLTLSGAISVGGSLSFTTGVTNLIDFSLADSSTLNLGTVHISGTLDMNYNGNISYSNVTLADNVQLVYGVGNNVFDLGTITQPVNLNLYDAWRSLSEGINLGIRTDGITEESLRTTINVYGLDSYNLAAGDDGYWYLNSADSLNDYGWDINWGSILADAPQLTSENICTDVTIGRTVVNDSYYMIDETFKDGKTETVLIDLQDTTNSNKDIVGGFATQYNSNSQGNVERDVWIKASAGSYRYIIGGNLSNNWYSGNPANFTGDTHILVDGDNVTIGSIIGANHFDSQSPTFRGNTYISVINGIITGDIIGSGTATHNVGTNNQVGDTHVFVYNGQTNGGYVAGGGIGGGFDTQNRNQKLTLEGNTHVTVDLSNQTGAVTFAKSIVGAHVYKKTAIPTLNHSGSTNITLIGNSDSGTKFTAHVIGGNYSAAGGTLNAGDTNISITNVPQFTGHVIGGNHSATGGTMHTGNVNMSITGGTFSNGNASSVVGGNFSASTGTMSVGNVNMSIAGYVDRNIFGANYVNTGQTEVQAQNIAITIGKNGTANWNLVGGHYINGNGEASLSGSVGDVTITLAGGTIKDTYGGSWILRNNNTANVTQGNIHIDLESGKLDGNVYAAGRQAGSSKMTTSSTKVSVGSNVTITDGKTISGGYRFENNKSGSTVTGGKTLVFNGGNQDRSGITFDSFDTIQVTNKDAVVTLGTLTNFTGLTKTGAGTLTLGSNSAYTGNTNVQGGELILTSSLSSGSISISQGAKLMLQSADFSLAQTVSGEGELVVKNGVVLTFGSSSKLGTHLRIEDGGRVEFSGTGSDQFNYGNNFFRTVYLKGTAELALGTTRQTVGNWTFDMTGGIISGQGQTDHPYALDFHRSATIVARADEAATTENPTVSTVSAAIRTKEQGEFKLDVENNARLDLTGAVNLGLKTIKDGAGLAVISGLIESLGAVEVQEGTLELQSSASSTSNLTVNTGAEFEISAGESTLSGTVTNSGAITVSGGTAVFTNTLSMDTGSSLNVSGGSATLRGAMTNNGSITVSGGTAMFTNTLGMGIGSGLNVSGGSATVSSALNVTGSGVQIGQSGDGVLNLTGQMSIAENGSATLSGAITLGHTITNDGNLTLNGTLHLTGDINTSFTTRGLGGSSFVLYDGTASENGNGFNKVSGASYWLTQSTEGVTGATNTLGGNFAQVDSKHVVYHGGKSYEVITENGQFYISTGDMTGTQYYITAGDVEVNSEVQSAATGYTLQGGNMQLTEGSVNTSDITYTSGFIALSAGAELVVDGMPAGMTANSLLSSILTSSSGGNVKITRSGLDTWDGEGTADSDYNLNSAFAGTLELAADVDFTLGKGGDGQYSDTATITQALTGLKLNNGSTLYYNASGATTIQNLQVAGASATIHFKDSKSTNAVQFTGKTQLDGALTVSTTYDGGITFANLVGSGRLSSSSGQGDFKTTISSLQYEGSTFSGSLSFTGGNNIVQVSTGMESNLSFASLNASGVKSFTFNAQANTTIGTLNAAGGIVNVSEDKTLNLGGGTAESQKQHSIGKLSAASAGVTLGNYATLTLGGGTADEPTTHSINSLTSASGSSISISENAELVLSSLSGVSGKIEGDGTLNLALNGTVNGANGIPTGIFAGSIDTVKLTNGTCMEITGYGQMSAFNYITNLVVEAGSTFSNRLTAQTIGSDNHTLTLAGAGGISDKPAAALAFGHATNNQADMTMTHSVLLADDATVWVNTSRVGILSGTVNGNGHVLTKTGEGELRLNGTVTGANLKVSEGTLTINGTATGSESVVVKGGTLKLGATTSSMQVGDTATITKDTASMHNVKLSEEGIASADETGDTKGTVSDAKVTLAALAEGTSFSIEDVTLSNVNIEAANASDRVNLSGLSATDVQLTKGEFHMMDQAQVQVGTGGATINLPEGGVSMHTSLLEGMTLGTEGSLVVDLGNLSVFKDMDSGKPTFSITLDGFSISGFNIDEFLSENPGIYFAADSWLGQLLVAQGASQYVKGDTLEAGAQAAAGTGSGVSVSYNSTSVGTVIIISGLQVPEPTTSTLGLIALSALAMRRRRK